MTNPRIYLPELDDRLVVEAANHTHAFWSGGRTLEQHIESQRSQLRCAGREILRYTGLMSETGLIASIKRYGLQVHLPCGEKAKAVGIGAVYTRLDARKSKAASELVNHVVAEARDEGCVLALLYSDIDPAFYERLGFVPLPALEHFAKPFEVSPEGKLELRRATDEDDEAMLAMYEASWDPSFLRPSRSVALFRYFRLRNHAIGTWIVRQDNRDVGYVIATIHDGQRDSGSPPPRTLWVDEWAAPGVDVRDIYGVLRRLAEEHNAEHIAAWLPPHLAGPPFVARTRADAIPMVRLLGGPLSSVDPARSFFGSLDHF